MNLSSLAEGVLFYSPFLASNALFLFLCLLSCDRSINRASRTPSFALLIFSRGFFESAENQHSWPRSELFSPSSAKPKS